MGAARTDKSVKRIQGRTGLCQASARRTEGELVADPSEQCMEIIMPEFEIASRRRALAIHFTGSCVRLGWNEAV